MERGVAFEKNSLPDEVEGRRWLLLQVEEFCVAGISGGRGGGGGGVGIGLFGGSGGGGGGCATVSSTFSEVLAGPLVHSSSNTEP